MRHLLFRGADNLFKRFTGGGGQPASPAGPEPPAPGQTGGPGATPAAATPPGTPAATPPAATPPGAPTATPPGTPAAPAIPPGTPATTPQPLLAGRFKTPEELERGYVELLRRMADQGQELGRLRQLEIQLPNLVQQQVQTYLSQQQAARPMTEEERRKLNEQLMDEFQEDPSGFMDKLTKRIQEDIRRDFEQQLTPIQSKVQHYDRLAYWNQQLSEAAGKYPDFQQVLPEMRNVIMQFGEAITNSPAGVEMAYSIAKGRLGAAQVNLQDPAVRQAVLQDPALRQQIIAEHYQQIRQGNAPPVVISGQPGGSPPATPSTEIRTLKDAGAAAAAYFKSKMGGGG